MGLPSYIRTAPIPLPNASHSMMKGLEKLGKARPGGSIIAFFR